MQLPTRACITVALLATAAAAGHELQFWRENIHLAITAADTVAVTGTYFFRTRTGRPLSVGVFYPFPVDSVHESPVRWCIVDCGTGDTVAARPATDGLLFAVDVPQQGACSLTVWYVQHVRCARARYILTTTAAWEEPLGPSTYQVSVPDTLQLEYLSYEADTVVRAGGRVEHRFSRDQFMPEHDIECTWRRRE